MPSPMEKLALERHSSPEPLADLVVEVLGDKEMTLMEIRGRITLPLGDEAETETLVRIAGAVWNLRSSGKVRRDEETQKYRVINHG